jgi:hypothetical protein
MKNMPLSLLVSIAVVSIFVMFSVMSLIPPTPDVYTQQQYIYAADPSPSAEPLELDFEYEE